MWTIQKWTEFEQREEHLEEWRWMLVRRLNLLWRHWWGFLRCFHCGHHNVNFSQCVCITYIFSFAVQFQVWTNLFDHFRNKFTFLTSFIVTYWRETNLINKIRIFINQTIIYLCQNEKCNTASHIKDRWYWCNVI